MNKAIIAICFALIFSLLTSVGAANELNLDSSSSEMISEKNQVGDEKNSALDGVDSAVLKGPNPALPFLLQRGQKACLDSCQVEFNSCMKSANSANSKYRCSDNRWRCTRSCDNEWYHHLHL